MPTITRKSESVLTARRLLALFGALCIVGCSTAPLPYYPATLGPVTYASVLDGMELVIEPVRDEYVFGDVIRFETLLRNVGDTAYWVPREPHIIYHWTYPNGIRDHFVREHPRPRRFAQRDVVLLEPGHQLIYHEDIETYYFPRPGITEFHARYLIIGNTNPAFEPYLNRRLVSNRYGVRLVPR